MAVHFADAEQISDYAANAFCWVVENEIINGKTNRVLDPKGTATRAECAAMLQRFCSYINER